MWHWNSRNWNKCTNVLLMREVFQLNWDPSESMDFALVKKPKMSDQILVSTSTQYGQSQIREHLQELWRVTLTVTLKHIVTLTECTHSLDEEMNWTTFCHCMRECTYRQALTWPRRKCMCSYRYQLCGSLAYLDLLNPPPANPDLFIFCSSTSAWALCCLMLFQRVSTSSTAWKKHSTSELDVFTQSTWISTFRLQTRQMTGSQHSE